MNILIIILKLLIALKELKITETFFSKMLSAKFLFSKQV